MSASSSRSASPQQPKANSTYISQFLTRRDDTPLFYSTLEERHPANVMEASEDSNHGLGRELVTGLGQHEEEQRHLGQEHEEDSPFRMTPSEARRTSAALLEDSLYSRSENSVLPQPQPRQTWRMHQPMRPESSMSNKASDLESHFVGQSVMLSPASQSPPSRSHSDLLSALSDAQSPTKPADDEPHPTLYVEQSEPQTHLKPQDSGWLAVYLTCCTITLGIAIYAYLFANPPYDLSIPETPDAEVEEAASLLSILPLLTSLTLLSILGAVSAIGYMFVQSGVRRIVYGLLIGCPSGLVMLSFWTWGFSWAEEQGNEARWVSLGACGLAGICVCMTWKRRGEIEKTVQVIEVSPRKTLMDII